MMHLGVVLSRMTTLAILWGALGCAEPLPAHAAYVPADCPTTDTPTFDTSPEPLLEPQLRQAKQAEAKRRPERVELDEKEDPAESSRVELNTANQAELEALPGIGPSLAKRIIARREKRAFRRVSQLRQVKGIGAAKYRELKGLVRVE